MACASREGPSSPMRPGKSPVGVSRRALGYEATAGTSGREGRGTCSMDEHRKNASLSELFAGKPTLIAYTFSAGSARSILRGRPGPGSPYQ